MRDLFDMRSGKLRAVTPAGTRGVKLSPGVGDDQEMLAWNADGHGIVVWNQELPANITIVNLTTGKRQLVQAVEPLAMLGSMYARMVASADGKTAVYRHRRGLYAIHIADGLR